jgi:hypothetical protein
MGIADFPMYPLPVSLTGCTVLESLDTLSLEAEYHPAIRHAVGDGLARQIQASAPGAAVVVHIGDGNLGLLKLVKRTLNPC